MAFTGNSDAQQSHVAVTCGSYMQQLQKAVARLKGVGGRYLVGVTFEQAAGAAAPLCWLSGCDSPQSQCSQPGRTNACIHHQAFAYIFVPYYRLYLQNTRVMFSFSIGSTQTPMPSFHSWTASYPCSSKMRMINDIAPLPVVDIAP